MFIAKSRCQLSRVPLWVAVLALGAGAATAQEKAQLAKGGKASFPVVVGDKASDAVRRSAAELATLLGRISGAGFEVKTGDASTGIAVGVARDFPALGLDDSFDAASSVGKEQYLLRSHPAGVHVIGATELAVGHGVWDLLYRLGYRHFFPGGNWEVVPRHEDLAIAVDANGKPDYLTRRIWYGYGETDYNSGPLQTWRTRNRALSVFTLNTGHSYDGIARQYKTEFDAHPEYFCHIDGKPTSKLCAGQQGLRDLVVRYAMDYFERNPDADTVSIDPSDGGGWGADCPCVELGPPTNRALTLANDIGEALDEAGLPKFVAMYAYAQHSPPPTIPAHPRVIISVATSFVRGGYSVDELLEGWKKQGVKRFGIREYYSVHPWDRDLPGKARGGNIDYLARTIPRFHEAGARFMSAESSDNWGANGLGYYLANRMMWDVDEARRIDELKADFFEKSFGPARGPMETFFELIDGSNKSLLSDDMLGRMYRSLAGASELAAGDAAIQPRLDDLVLYVRYVELFRRYSGASGDDRQAAFEKLIRHAYRMRETMMVHVKGLYRDLVRRDDNVSTPDEAGWGVPEGKNPWKSSEEFTRPELDGIVSEGIANHGLLGFRPMAYTDDLVPATSLNLADTTLGEGSWSGRGQRAYYTWIDETPGEIRLQVTGGLIAHYRNRGNVKIQLFPAAEVEGLSVAEAAVPPDGETREVILRTDHSGLHRIELNDGNDMTRIEPGPGLTLTFETDINHRMMDCVFYVPRGTELVGGFFSGQRGALHDAVGRRVFELTGPGHFEVPVPGGQDGKLWSIRGANGTVQLMTVPPHGSHRATGLLLPREVVEADAGKNRR